MQDRRVVLLVISILGAFALGGLAAVVVMVLHGSTVPDPMWTLEGTALGALGTVLVSTHSSPPNLPTVEVPVVPAGAAPAAPPAPVVLRPGQQAVNQPKGA